MSSIYCKSFSFNFKFNFPWNIAFVWLCFLPKQLTAPVSLEYMCVESVNRTPELVHIVTHKMSHTESRDLKNRYSGSTEPEGIYLFSETSTFFNDKLRQATLNNKLSVNCYMTNLLRPVNVTAVTETSFTFKCFNLKTIYFIQVICASNLSTPSDVIHVWWVKWWSWRGWECWWELTLTYTAKKGND